MNIKQARIELAGVACDLYNIEHKDISERIHSIIREHMFKEKSSHPVTARKSQPMTTFLGRSIRAYKQRNPDKSVQQIAEHFTVNHGRVSQALAGKW